LVTQECKRKYGSKVIVGMIPMVLGELYLSLSLRGDEENIGGHQKKRYWGTAEARKKHSYPPI
jgi:hypothetical protein